MAQARRNRRPLILIGGLLAILLLAAAVLAVSFQWSWLRGPLESRLSGMLGREVRIEGTISGDLGPITRLAMREVRLADADWTGRRDMVELGRLRLDFALASLLVGPLEIDNLRFDSPHIWLKRHQDGRVNWPAWLTGDRPRIDSITLEYGRISIEDSACGLSLQFSLDTDPPQRGQRFLASGEGRYGMTAFRISAETGDAVAALRDRAPLPLTVSLTGGQATSALSGAIAPDGRLSLNGTVLPEGCAALFDGLFPG